MVIGPVSFCEIYYLLDREMEVIQGSFWFTDPLFEV